MLKHEYDKVDAAIYPYVVCYDIGRNFFKLTAVTKWLHENKKGMHVHRQQHVHFELEETAIAFKLMFGGE